MRDAQKIIMIKCALKELHLSNEIAFLSLRQKFLGVF